MLAELRKAPPAVIEYGAHVQLNLHLYLAGHRARAADGQPTSDRLAAHTPCALSGSVIISRFQDCLKQALNNARKSRRQVFL